MSPLLRLVPIALLSALMVPAHASVASAHGPSQARRWTAPAAQPLVSVDVVDDRGVSFSSVRHRGRVFVAGERGQRYEIQLSNNTNRRIEVIVSVDGRDVVTGERANTSKHRGYVLEPFGTVTIDGFRRSLDRVAAFRFSGVSDSYAARRGSGASAGVISIQAFKERRQRPAPIARDRRPRSSAPKSDDFVEFEPHGGASKSPSAPGSSPAKKSAKGKSASRSRWRPPRTEQELGTEFGENRHSRARRVSFVRQSSRPDFSTRLFYDSAHALADRGIPIEPVNTWSPPPHFEETQHFAPPPPPRHNHWRR